MIITKWDYHIYDILDTLQEFGMETDLQAYTDGDAQRDKALQDLWSVFSHPECAIIAVYDVCDEDTIAGFAVLFLDRLFLQGTRGFGIVNKFYIRKQYRGKHYGRQLANECVDWFTANNVSESFVTSTGEIGETKQFENLFRKFGYTTIGSCMRRKHE